MLFGFFFFDLFFLRDVLQHAIQTDHLSIFIGNGGDHRSVPLDSTILHDDLEHFTALYVGGSNLPDQCQHFLLFWFLIKGSGIK